MLNFRLRCVLAVLLLAGIYGVGYAQSAITPPAATRAFELDIQAPAELKELLQRHLELLRYRELTDLSDSELARLLTSAQQDAREMAGTMGYFSPEVRAEQHATPEGQTARRVTLTVLPGAPTVVREVHIQFTDAMAGDGAAAAQRQLIQANWSLRSGMRFTQAGWDNAKLQALRQMTAQRYPAGQLIDTLVDIDPDDHSARLTVTLASGPAYRLGPLVIKGTKHHSTELVTRLARLPVGADYDQNQLVQAQQRLADSGYFDSVFMSLDTSGNPAAAPVNLQLTEAKLQKAVFGVGASTDAGARLSLEHTHQQVPGIGWRAVSKVLLDRETRSLASDWTAPPDAGNWRWGGGVLLQNQQVGSFPVNSQRLRAGRSQNGENIDRNYYLQYDRAHSATSDPAAPAVADALSANYAFTLRHFDSLPFPSSGWGLGVELGGGLTLGGQRDPYGRVLARWLGYQPLGRSADSGMTDARAGRLALRAEGGAVVAKDGVTLPATQLFLTGGDNSVRGYGYHDLGVTLPDGKTTTGRYLATGSVEWQKPLPADGRFADWEGTLFLDAGAVADKPAELRAKVGVGAGLRWRSPVGPLQIDLAYGVAVKKFRLHMTVGFSF
jgi:translocation and assembly module TamA